MKRRAWYAGLVLCGQAAMMLALSLLLLWLAIALEAPMGGAAYDIAMWAVVPLLGLSSAWLCVRIGVPYGIAWIAPPLCQVAAQWLLTGVLPASPGMPMVTALLSAFGASAGYEQLRRMNKRKKM